MGGQGCRIFCRGDTLAQKEEVWLRLVHFAHTSPKYKKTLKSPYHLIGDTLNKLFSIDGKLISSS